MSKLLASIPGPRSFWFDVSASSAGVELVLTEDDTEMRVTLDKDLAAMLATTIDQAITVHCAMTLDEDDDAERPERKGRVS